MDIFLPMVWRQTRETFIRKLGKASKTEAKACSPISLSSFLRTTMEKLTSG
jgi:hypothetical protein